MTRHTLRAILKNTLKRIIRHYVIDTFSLFVVSRIAQGMVFAKGWEDLFLAGVGLTIVSLLAKPVIGILLLPINLLTFGLFRWVSSAITLYIVTLIVPGFSILGFNFVGFSTKWFDIPAVSFTGILAFVAFSFVLSFFSSIIYWIIK